MAEDRSGSLPESALRVIDIADPTEPVEVAEVVFGGERIVEGLAVTPSAVFVGAGFWEWDESGQFTVHRSEIQMWERVGPSSLIPRAVIPLATDLKGLAANGTSLYTIEWGSTLRVFDVSNLEAAVPIGSLSMNGEFSTMHVEGSMLLLPETKSNRFPSNPPGLRIIDVSNAAAPVEIGFAALPNDARDVDVSGTTAVVVLRDGTYCCSEGIHTVDLSDPANPQPLTRLIFGGYPTAVHMVGSLAVVGNAHQSGTHVIDVSIASSPEIIANFIPDTTSGALDVVGSTAVLGAWEDVTLVDLQEMTRPLVVSSIETPGDASGVRVQGELAYVADAEEGLRILDITDPLNPVLLGTLGTPGQTRFLLLDGATAYLAEGDAGIRIADVSDPGLPVVLGSLDTPGHAKGLDLWGGLLYVADQLGGLRIVDVTDPTDPVELGSVASAETTWGVDVQGSHAYMADGGAGLRVIDVSDATQPVEVGSLDPPNPSIVLGVTVAGDLLYIADPFGIRVVDVSGAIPVELDVVKPGASELVIVNANRLVAANADGVRVFDLSMAEHPRYLGGTRVAFGIGAGGSISLDVADGLVYAASNANGIVGVIGVLDFGSEYGLGTAPAVSISEVARTLMMLTVGAIGWNRTRRIR